MRDGVRCLTLGRGVSNTVQHMDGLVEGFEIHVYTVNSVRTAMFGRVRELRGRRLRGG